jgi:hypothetical protein
MENLIIVNIIVFNTSFLSIGHYTTKIRFLLEDRKGYSLFFDGLSERNVHDRLPILMYPKTGDNAFLVYYKRRNFFVYLFWSNIVLLILAVLILSKN